MLFKLLNESEEYFCKQTTDVEKDLYYGITRCTAIERSVETRDLLPRDKKAVEEGEEIKKLETSQIVFFLEQSALRRKAAIFPYKSMLLWMLAAVSTAFVVGF